MLTQTQKQTKSSFHLSSQTFLARLIFWGFQHSSHFSVDAVAGVVVIVGGSVVVVIVGGSVVDVVVDDTFVSTGGRRKERKEKFFNLKPN